MMWKMRLGRPPSKKKLGEGNSWVLGHDKNWEPLKGK